MDRTGLVHIRFLYSYPMCFKLRLENRNIDDCFLLDIYFSLFKKYFFIHWLDFGLAIYLQLGHNWLQHEICTIFFITLLFEWIYVTNDGNSQWKVCVSFYNSIRHIQTLCLFCMLMCVQKISKFEYELNWKCEEGTLILK